MYTVIKGGLGNQMFQIAFAFLKAEEKINKIKLIDFTSSEKTKRKIALNVFNIKNKRVTKLSSHLWTLLIFLLERSPFRYGVFPNFYMQDLGYDHFCKFRYSSPKIINGYWQYGDYYLSKRDSIRKLFSFPKSCPSDEIFRNISSKNLVAVHVRRGDYASDQNTMRRHLVCDSNWYQSSMVKMAKKLEDPHFIIFSDDEEWVINNIDFDKNFVTVLGKSDSREDWQDMRLMSLCDHFILSNSSFSWWSAFLGESENSLIYVPRFWYSGVKTDDVKICPSHWERL